MTDEEFERRLERVLSMGALLIYDDDVEVMEWEALLGEDA